ncbi:carbohydrate kinase family protein [Maritimibacter sp. HL-12]|uniref:carbohydrate kinase family protein n=1 Tax=Maritimibacter sp. HL-12 TaxID=1162418 RepID=UPI000A0F2CCF|nr:carbohydrate kinase family protein [Maritimibacter sp. HL-12]SMH37901.1 Sugar or nucleoside kinase, ribokinase family [Maritimibacter sp. HL-12]
MERAICVIGNANLDVVMGPLDGWPEPGTEVFLPKSDFRIGGSAANTALVLRRLSARAGLVSGCGTDPAGDMIAARFRSGLDRMTRFETATGVSVGVLFSDAERSFLSTPGHLAELTRATFRAGLDDWPLDGALVMVSGAFALPGLLADHEALLDDLRAAGAELAIDPGWPDAGWSAATRKRVLGWIARADHVLLNDKELAGLTGCDDTQEGLARLAEQAAPGTCLVAKAGAAGCYGRQGQLAAHADADRIAVFDTVGAGDAFNAGYLFAVARGEPLAAALSSGNRVAARVVAQFPRSPEPLTAPPLPADR